MKKLLKPIQPNIYMYIGIVSVNDGLGICIQVSSLFFCPHQTY